jgi:hypothetical protein
MELVIIFVDPRFGDRLAELGDGRPVWIPDAPVNRPAAERLWRDRANGAQTYDITTFVVDSSFRPDEWCADILEVVDEHHGLSESRGQSLRAVGCRSSPELAERLDRLGLTDVAHTNDGFVPQRRDLHDEPQT